MARTLIGVYPGTFDPVTNGHIDIISRAVRLVDHLVIGIAANPSKGPMFSAEERVSMLYEELESIDQNGTKVEVRPFRNLLTDFARDVGATMILRGLRAVSDFDFEFQMVGMNARLAPDIEIVFLMASEGNHFIASRLVKEIAMLGGDASKFVSANVAKHIAARLKEIGSAGR
ncbi:MAG: pantetheine-phosphate adenylyltransferase [Alphaproteobacteria bacterium]|nr:pantetheine-phosphate adenylyltransferase [Alphaproteobacteria bacterium]